MKADRSNETHLALADRRCRPSDRLLALPLPVGKQLERHAGCGTGNREGEATLATSVGSLRLQSPFRPEPIFFGRTLWAISGRP